MYLITVLSNTLDCFLTDKIDPEGLTINDICYRNEEGGDWTGFYDFLRTNENMVIGIRYAPLVDDSTFLKTLVQKAYVKLLPNSSVELYFSNDHSFVPELSDDQRFGENMLLRSKEGAYAITFGIEQLNPLELAQIRNIATILD
jgi:hypothetical protein